MTAGVVIFYLDIWNPEER